MCLKIHHLSIPTGEGVAPPALFRNPLRCKPALAQNDRTDPASFRHARSGPGRMRPDGRLTRSARAANIGGLRIEQ
jgi:hypothetical protein